MLDLLHIPEIQKGIGNDYKSAIRFLSRIPYLVSRIFLNRVLVFFIRLYQMLLSPFIGPVCRFTPSCSHYAVDALNQYPIHRALPRILYRLLRCNPFYRGGYDPVRKG